MDIVVEAGDREHECCGAAIERDDVVTFDCIHHVEPDGRVRLIESHHDRGTSERVKGRVSDIHVVQDAGASRPILRVPSGSALRGFDPEDDGHLEDPWTGEVITSDSTDFLVTVRTSR
ncbi:hypothetical protein MO973_31780 [Paenibacillus sp. TRM 82003]|uniref:hypothetical protein n=1 Tax=Kineococcus sp. TRM81007 TaxID=2925831 RepID=UPI001F5AF366|nr:hypothetical protein [Kineococcus sp. TRM81007]MCI2239119.1 hypothetical protein [Kineococcus sp. TRM81007]MCI3922146.1 hypothetical protein [Paenibacillus sp. TRM 82003]MCI3924798.1 hypothetical protein [Paenibacillus sp. TRM 82003]